MKFTIVIPVHNGMPFVKECIQSALSQDYPHYNIIILENKSDDGTAEYLDSLQSPKIQIIKSDRLLSIEENWARIKDLPLHPYMTILMADDKLETNYLSLIAKTIRKHPACNIYRTNLHLMNEKAEVFHASNIKEKITIYDYLKGRLSHTYTETAAGYCFKTSRYKEIGGIDCKYRLMHTDDKLFMQAIGEQNYMAVSPSYGANYRCHTGSESGSPNPQATLNGYNYWLNWIYNLNDPKLRQIVRTYLPYHLTQIARFFTPQELEKHKEIYSLYKINEKDLRHRFVACKLRHNLNCKKIIETLFSVTNKYKNGKKKKVIKLLGIRLSFPVKQGGPHA